ncbi:MAG: RluA family pseudouridine synthase [Deltaproteobacteria bacterium]|jgi:23S rRNA pseudouridine1911/1915/1917 synthase|nr:RluA family pseudouridine synthase [Deltaproteobacteria bacterium]
MTFLIPEDFTSFFDDPISDPPPSGPPYTNYPPTLAGELDPLMAGRPLQELAAKISGLNVKEAGELVDFGAMWIDNRQKMDPLFPLPSQGEFRLNYPKYGPVKFYEVDLKRVVYEDEEIIVYDKESGRPSQAVRHDAYNNVLSALIRVKKIFLRLPHRLDLGTSGLLLLAKTQKSAGILGKSFQAGKVLKRYIALATGEPPKWKEKVAEMAIAKCAGKLIARERGPGLASKTELKVLATKENKVLFLAIPHTGRTHQIRLHLSFLGYPIVGDYFYGGETFPRLMLKAAGLAFHHPLSKKPLFLGGPFSGDETI